MRFSCLQRSLGFLLSAIVTHWGRAHAQAPYGSQHCMADKCLVDNKFDPSCCAEPSRASCAAGGVYSQGQMCSNSQGKQLFRTCCSGVSYGNSQYEKYGGTTPGPLDRPVVKGAGTVAAGVGIGVAGGVAAGAIVAGTVLGIRAAVDSSKGGTTSAPLQQAAPWGPVPAGATTTGPSFMGFQLPGLPRKMSKTNSPNVAQPKTPVAVALSLYLIVAALSCLCLVAFVGAVAACLCRNKKEVRGAEYALVSPESATE